MRITRHQVHNSQGHSLYLADKLKQGGEGAIYDVQGQANLVAKIYFARINPAKAEKLALMVSLKTERLLKLAAWPTDILYDRPGGQTVGFLMNKLVGYDDVHVLYGVKSRLAQFPEARWPFLIQTAANVARAFRLIHEQKHVIGDINHGSVGVSKNSTVTLFDCDSFQIISQGRQYLCAVGIDTHTPPELQGRSLQGVIRTTNHDAFGLAVIIFQLLFLGRHPFAGKFLGGKETPPLGKLISEYRFAYGPNARARSMEQPVGTIPLEAVSQPIANLFEQAFSPGGARPTAESWVDALTGLASNLKQCGANSGHSYLKSLPSCPWCNVEGLSGVLVFTPVYAIGVVKDGQFNLALIWTQIAAVHAPGPLPALPDRSNFKLPVSAEASKIIRQQFLRSSIASGVVLTVSIALFALPVPVSTTVLLVFFTGVAATLIAKAGNKETRKRFDDAKQSATRKWSEAQERWKAQAAPERFLAKRKELEFQKADYEGLAALRLKNLNELERNLRQRQLEKFMDRHLIAIAAISGIGPGRQATLRSFGIETAADINRHSISQVPGFGPVLTSNLLSWRNSVERLFVFNPGRGVDPADKAAVEKEIADKRMRIERELRGGASQLRQTAHQIIGARTALTPILETTLQDQIRADKDRASLNLGPVHLLPIGLAVAASLIAMMPLKQRFGTVQSNGTNSIASRRAPTPQPTLSPSAGSNLGGAQQYFSEGVQLTKARKYQQAVLAYQKALVADPEMAEAHHELAFAYYKLGKFKESIASSQEAIKRKPDDPENYRNLGLAESGLAKWKDALSAFQQADKLAPNDATTQYQLGLAHKNLDEVDPAIASFEKAIRLKSDFALAHYELGVLYIALDESQLAGEQYDILLKLNPKFADKLQQNAPVVTPTPAPFRP